MSSGKKNKFREPELVESDLAIEEYIPEEESPGVNKKRKPKNTSEPAATKKKQEPLPVKKGRLLENIKHARSIYSSERAQKIRGLVLLLTASYLSIAFISYFFSWSVDQDKVLGPTSELFLPDTKVNNWLGKFGALVSHLFLYKWFGVSSFVLVPVLVLRGIEKLVQRQVHTIANFYAKCLFVVTWSSLVLSFFFAERLFYMGGGFGYFINAQISNLIGNSGLIALLAFSLLTYLVITINMNFSLPQRENHQESDASAHETPATTETEPVFVNRMKQDSSEPVLSAEEEAELLNFEVLQKPQEKVVTPQVVDLSTESLEMPAETPKAPEPKTSGDKNEPEFEIGGTVQEPSNLEEGNKAAELVEQFGEYDPTLDLGTYRFPGFELLNDYGNIHSKVNQEELIANKNRILSTLKNYGIEIDKITATVGPTVTLYEIVPAAGVRISKIKNLEDDIALSLSALGIRIIAPIPGRGTIGIEVPNQNPEMVPMKNIMASEKFNHSQFELPIALGKTISNEIFVADLTKMPHLLMAGATGQGKSVGLNAVLVSLLYKKHPSQVKFVLVDPKKVELTLFNKIERHFLAKLPNSEDAIITDNTKVIHTLNSLCIEMDNRYALLQDAQVRNIKEYNAKFVQRKLNPNDGHKFLPYIVLVVDEFADLIMTAGKEVETPIARLAQLARAVGIHLIIATQRPSVNIITGTIKANFPARIAFRVTSKIDSRTILDTGGAEQLIGRGDMLLSTGNDLIRIQCAFVDTPEVEKITEFIGNQRAYPSAFLLPEYVGEEGDGKEDVDLSDRDKMFDDAARLVVQFQQGSASFLQRKLKLGYNRAGRIVDQLEAAGVIGPFEGSKAREVLIKDMAHLDDILQKLRNQ
ncbi:MAG: DNA translocase FtsK 4TM domain-containing protein [Bacteroidia bacterium]|nr:DNA translocase FtsK 4TM domain-containing protein [Bacteroidia bacterium]